MFSESDYVVGSEPLAVATADFNGDGKPDLAVANYGDRTVSILLGKPNGSFRSVQNYRTAGSSFVAAGDFNGDHKVDLALVGNDHLSILLGNGNGTFQPYVAYSDPGVVHLATADFNHDGKLDLVIADAQNKGGAFVLLGNGDGTFQAPIQVAHETSYWAVPGDFNGDGNLDLAVQVGSTVVIYLGNGDGTFSKPHSQFTSDGGSQLAEGDFNRDGKLDLVVPAQLYQSCGVTIWLGNGDGTFTREQTFLAGGNFANLVTVADLNGDGKPDLIVNVLYYGENGFSVLLGNGDGTFQPYTEYVAGGNTSSFAVADFNGDHKPDLAVTNTNCFGTCNGIVSILLGNGAGVFSPRKDFALSGTSSWVITGDFNGDGKLDLAVTLPVSNYVSIQLGNGDGTFQPPVNYAIAAGLEDRLATADFNGDGALDLAVGTSATVSVLLGNGDGTFQGPSQYATGRFSGDVAAGDFNGDGKVDLAVTTSDNGDLLILPGNGDGTFLSPIVTPVVFGAWGISVADFNRDGKLDVAVTTFETAGTVYVLVGNGDGTFQPASGYGITAYAEAIATGDLNGDGFPDLVSPADECFCISVLLGNGDGTFQTHLDYPDPFSDHSVVAMADMNGDGKLDVVLGGDYGQNSLAVFLGNGDGTLGWPFTYFAPGTSVAVGDFNGDGTTDIAAAGRSATGSSVDSVFLGNPAVALHPDSINFGSQGVGTSSEATVMLTNNGMAPLAITWIGITGTDSGDFSETSTCAPVIAPGASCNISVTFTPSQQGSRHGVLRILDNAQGGSQPIGLSGTGT